jgi:hypothetical protein
MARPFFPNTTGVHHRNLIGDLRDAASERIAYMFLNADLQRRHRVIGNQRAGAGPEELLSSSCAGAIRQTS